MITIQEIEKQYIEEMRNDGFPNGNAPLDGWIFRDWLLKQYCAKLEKLERCACSLKDISDWTKARDGSPERDETNLMEIDTIARMAIQDASQDEVKTPNETTGKS